jgi:hypothetical protein
LSEDPVALRPILSNGLPLIIIIYILLQFHYKYSISTDDFKGIFFRNPLKHIKLNVL